MDKKVKRFCLVVALGVGLAGVFLVLMYGTMAFQDKGMEGTSMLLYCTATMILPIGLLAYYPLEVTGLRLAARFVTICILAGSMVLYIGYITTPYMR